MLESPTEKPKAYRALGYFFAELNLLTQEGVERKIYKEVEISLCDEGLVLIGPDQEFRVSPFDILHSEYEFGSKKVGGRIQWVCDQLHYDLKLSSSDENIRLLRLSICHWKLFKQGIKEEDWISCSCCERPILKVEGAKYLYCTGCKQVMDTKSQLITQEKWRHFNFNHQLRFSQVAKLGEVYSSGTKEVMEATFDPVERGFKSYLKSGSLQLGMSLLWLSGYFYYFFEPWALVISFIQAVWGLSYFLEASFKGLWWDYFLGSKTKRSLQKALDQGFFEQGSLGERVNKAWYFRDCSKQKEAYREVLEAYKLCPNHPLLTVLCSKFSDNQELAYKWCLKTTELYDQNEHYSLGNQAGSDGREEKKGMARAEKKSV